MWEGEHMTTGQLIEPSSPTLVAKAFRLRPIRGSDAPRDYEAVMETREYLRHWELSTWPEDDFTVEANREDLDECERRHIAGKAFTYTVLDPVGEECLGCVYVFPTTANFLAKAAVAALTGDAWGDVEAVVFFWVRASKMATGLDRHLLGALNAWFRGQWRLNRVVWTTSEEFTHQLELFRSEGMSERFSIKEPDKRGRHLAFATA